MAKDAQEEVKDRMMCPHRRRDADLFNHSRLPRIVWLLPDFEMLGQGC